MTPSSEYSVTVQRAAPRSFAAVHARMPTSRVAAEFKRYLDQVYAARERGIDLDGQNIFLYRNAMDAPGLLDVDFGVGVRAPVAAVGDVRPVELPQGEVATTTHRGGYAGLGAAHAAVIAWCHAHAYSLAGPRWEVYGHWSDGEQPRTDIFYLLEPGGSHDLRGEAGGVRRDDER